MKRELGGDSKHSKFVMNCKPLFKEGDASELTFKRFLTTLSLQVAL